MKATSHSAVFCNTCKLLYHSVVYHIHSCVHVRHPSPPLYRAAIVSLLIAGGAEVGAENQEGETPQMYAEYRNHDTVAKLLHEAADQGMGKTDGTIRCIYSDHGICFSFSVCSGKNVHVVFHHLILTCLKCLDKQLLIACQLQL